MNKSKDKDSNKSVITKSITSPVLGSPMRTISNENSSQFKMRARRSNINYDELEDEEEPSDYKI